MADTFSLNIQANSSNAEEALKQLKQGFDAGKQSAEALNHVIDGDLSEAFKSLGELTKSLGIELGLAFSPAEIIAFVQVIADVTDKLSKLIADTFIYTDEQKALDAQIKSSNQVIAGYATDIKKLDDEFEKMGKTASQKTAIDIAKLKPQLDAASEAVRTLKGDLKEAKENAANPNLINALGNAMAIPGLNAELGVAQQHLKLLNAQMRNLKEAFREQHAAESELNAEAQKSKAAFAKAQTDKVATVNTTTSTIISIGEKGNQQAMAADFAAIKAENDAVIKAANEQMQTWDEGYKGQIEVAKIASETTIQLITQQFEKGKITQQQEIALIAKAKQDELALEIYYQQQRQALWDKDPKKVQEIQNQINKIKAQSELIGVKATTDELKASEQKWKSFTSSISQSLNSALSGWIQGTQTFGQAWAKMADDMAMKFISSLEQQLVQFLVHLAVKDAADKAASAKNNLRAAYDSAHNTYKWATGIVGPVVAGVLAAGAFVAAESLGSAEGANITFPTISSQCSTPRKWSYLQESPTRCVALLVAVEAAAPE